MAIVKWLKLIKAQDGFSFLEVTIAMGVITMGLLGVSSLVRLNLQAQNVNRDYLTASMLAQEGIELVRNLRDKNWLESGVNWDDQINASSYSIDYDSSPASVSDITDAGAKLYIDGNNMYNHTGVTATPFNRLITTSLAADGSIIVNCTVQWIERGARKNYSAETRLYNWRP